MTRLTLAALLLLSAPAGAQTGQADRVIDGDTFEMGGETIRLWGIDAPEMSGDCRFWGLEAQDMLAFLLADGVTCEMPPDGQDRDPWGRLVRVCAGVDRPDAAATLVYAGRGWDWPSYSGGAYAPYQAVAREHGMGLWADDTCRPDWWEGD